MFTFLRQRKNQFDEFARNRLIQHWIAYTYKVYHNRLEMFARKIHYTPVKLLPQKPPNKRYRTLEPNIWKDLVLHLRQERMVNNLCMYGNSLYYKFSILQTMYVWQVPGIHHWSLFIGPNNSICNNISNGPAL